MKEVKIEDKEKYLKEHYPFENIPNLRDQRRCIHCDRIFTIGDYKVFIDEDDEELIYCPYAPECDGTLIDWIPVDYDYK